MLTIFLGAGFSKWAANLPVASELFDFKINSFGTREINKLEEISKIKLEWDKNNFNGHSEEFIEFSYNSMGKIRDLVQWYIVRRLYNASDVN